MKIEVIPVKDLEKYLNLVKKERDLTVLLHYFHEQQKLQAKRLENIKNLASYLCNYKRGKYASWFKQLDPELQKIINKHGI
jgi:hypothetical protein